MTNKELEKLINEQIINKGFDKNSTDIWCVKVRVRDILKELLEEHLPTVDYNVHDGYKWYEGQKEHRIYMSPKYHNYNDGEISPVEIQIHKVLDYTNYRGMGQWFISKVTVKNLTENKSLEQFYNDYAKSVEERERYYEEKKKKEAEERIEREKQYEITATENANKVMQYIKDHNLDVDEFIEISKTYSLYNDKFRKLFR